MPMLRKQFMQLTVESTAWKKRTEKFIAWFWTIWRSAGNKNGFPSHYMSMETRGFQSEKEYLLPQKLKISVYFLKGGCLRRISSIISNTGRIFRMKTIIFIKAEKTFSSQGMNSFTIRWKKAYPKANFPLRMRFWRVKILTWTAIRWKISEAEA